MNSGDYKTQAEHHDREAAAMQAKIDQAEKALETMRQRFEVDIAAAQAKIDSLLPYKDTSMEHQKEISDWEARITTLEQERDRQLPKINAELDQHRKAYDDYKSQAAKAWELYETTKTAEERRRLLILAQRAQDPNAGPSSDQLAA
ncbi:hypothetical protein EYC58_01860 [Candidatus Saccharibacteria bacterium]|nr:MAG: hypothetical protein EYC58_01860 [Candidatus Saccharibacteria bacterium]